MNSIIIIGAGGHGKVVAEIASLCGYKEIAFLDNDINIKSCLGYPVIGTSEECYKYREQAFFVAIGNAKVREKIYQELLTHRIKIATLIHPSAIVSHDASIGSGTVIMAGAIINPGTKIGIGCIVNTGASVDHDNILEDFVHISVGSHLAGNVYIGHHTWIGAGAVVSNNVCICKDCMIGAGAVVNKNIDIPGTYIGVPAKKMS